MQFPVSIKGVVFRDERAILLRNERDEWELPGGKLEPDEEPEACCAREIREELALDVKRRGADRHQQRAQGSGPVPRAGAGRAADAGGLPRFRPPLVEPKIYWIR